MRFTKMHGIGNDYVYVNCFDQHVAEPEKLARLVSNRHKGVGADGLILICPSETADARMRIFNADGSEAEMCGNGIRCVAKYVHDHKVAKPGPALVLADGSWDCPASLKIETGRGVLTLGLSVDEQGLVDNVCVNMGPPVLDPAMIPVRLDGESIVQRGISVGGQTLLMTCVSMGNPHAVFFCDDVSSIQLDRLGPLIESHDLFPNRTNVHFVQVNGDDEFTMRTWERGSGITMACGTGACACCAAGVLERKTARRCTAHLPGGNLALAWCKMDDCVYMSGPATEVFAGIWPD